MKQIQSLREVIKKLGYVLPKNKKNKAYILVVLIIIGSLLETLGVSAILPFIESILSPSELLNKWYVKWMVIITNVSDETSIVIVLGICIIFVYLIKNVYLYSLIIIQTVYRSKVQKELSTKMLATYMKREYEYYVNINTAEIIRGIGTDVTGVYNLLDNIFRFLGEAFTALMISVYILYTDFVMAVCIIAIAGGCFLLLTVGLKGKTKRLGEEKRVCDTIRGKRAYQAIMGFKEIKVMHKEKFFVDTYDDAYEKQRVADVRNEYIANIPEKLIEFVCVATLIGVLCIRISLGVDLTAFVPKLAAFALAAFRLLPSVSRMTRYINGIVFNNAFLISAYNNLRELGDFENELQLYNADANYDAVEFKNSIEIKDVRWNYKNSSKVILDNLNLSINRGESIGIIGASGAGKSTLMDIILGLLRPNQGKILMDGIDVYSISKQWSDMIAYVPQSVFLLDDTIRNNVAFGVTMDKIDDEKVWSALKEAQLEDFVKSLPDKLDTQVGERGIKFSGGQRQRVAIARALYRNPEIIVLDEATSALDNETEKAVMEAIEILKGQKTLIIVAHRLSTIRNCDKVYEVGNGKINLKEFS